MTSTISWGGSHWDPFPKTTHFFSGFALNLAIPELFISRTFFLEKSTGQNCFETLWVWCLCSHGKNQAFSCPGIEICIKYFLQRGHLENQITAFVPQSRLCRPRPSHKPIVGQHLLQKLADRGLVVFTPARKVPGRNIVCYDDRYLVAPETVLLRPLLPPSW